MLSLCSFQDAHEDRGRISPPRFFKTIQLARDSGFKYGAFTPSGGAFQLSSSTFLSPLCRPATPKGMPLGLGSFPFARRYLGNRSFFLFLRVLRCFSSPGALLATYLIQLRVTGHYSRRVPPFGYLRINACLRLLVAFRSLPRPSSAYGALASTLRSCSLDFLVALWYQSLGI